MQVSEVVKIPSPVVDSISTPVTPARPSKGESSSWWKSGLALAVILFLGWLSLETIQHKTDIAVMKEDIGRILNNMPSARLAKLASNPTEENIVQAQKLIVEAKASNTLIPTKTVEEAGKNFVQVAFEDTKLSHMAWNTVTDLLNYRSMLTANFDPHYGQILGKPAQEPPPPGLPPGIRIYFMNGAVDGGTYALDGTLWENTTFRNTHVIYNGGPAVLKNVVFENCTFTISFVFSSQKLVEALLVNPATVRIPS